MNSRLKGITFALVSSSTFGLIPLLVIPLMKDQAIGLSSILFYRFLFSTIMIGLICLIQKKKMYITPSNCLSVTFFSFLYAATALALTFAYTLIPSGVATTIHFLYPIFVSFLMITFFREKKSLMLLIATLLSLLGVGFLCWNGSDSLNLWGVLVAIVTVVTYGFYIVSINQSKAGKIDAEVLTFYILLCGTVFFFFIAIFNGGIDPIPSNISSWTRILLLAFLPTVISDLTLILAIKYAGSTITSILGSMEPLVSVLIGVFYFHEYFDIYVFLGFVLILISVLLIIFFTKKRDSVLGKTE